MTTLTGKTIYIAGPMSFRADTDFNFPAFDAAATALRAKGFTVLNPAEWADTTMGYDFNLRRSLGVLVAQANAVALLPGWIKSTGARLEVDIAKAFEWPVVTVAEALSDGS